MWKKDEAADPTPSPRPEARQRSERPGAGTGSGELATIGRSISIKGEVTGNEDLLIQGRVDGSVDLKQHSVTVGTEGEVKADIVARVVTVEGRVEGNVKGDEQVILRSSAVVEGDITAPRVVLEDGARFRGGVDMGEVAASPGGGPGGRAPSRKEPEVRRPQPQPQGGGASATKPEEKSESTVEAEK